MRKSLFIILFVIATRNSFSQTYYAFPDSNATWVETHQWGGSYPCIQVNDYEIYIEKDTLINNLKYSKLAYHNHYYINAYQGCYNTNQSYTNGTYGFYRNDSANQRVYIRNYFMFNSSSDTLLYDFSKLVGDTVQALMGSYVIDSITTIIIGNTSRKVQNVVYLPDAGQSSRTQIIEGVGSAQGLVPYPGDWEGGDMLVCFSQNNQKLYPDTNGVCQHINSIAIQNEIKIKTFPNPASDKIYFEGIDLNKNTSIRIANVVGEIVNPLCPLDISPSGEKSPSMDVSNLKNGIYFIDILQENKILERQKIVIQH